MSNFQAAFSYYPTQLIAPIEVEFSDKSTVGSALVDENTIAVDSSGNVVTGVDLYSANAIRIEKWIWSFSDGTYSNDQNPKKLFQFSGTIGIRLEIFSEELYDQNTGIIYRLKNILDQDIKIETMTLGWLSDHMTQPHKEALETSVGFKDLITSTSKMFDRMYKEIADVSVIMDVKNVAPKFLEYFSDTLNHARFYATKVGYAQQDPTNNFQQFLEYDFFDRVKNGIAGENEIIKFRQFIIDTAKLFKEKGSEQSIKDFFKLYDFIINIKPLWTTNFGTTSGPEIVESFLVDPTLEKTKSGFKYNGVSVVGWDNSLGQVVPGFNSIILDNYHYTTRHHYESGVDAGCDATFSINDYSPNVLSVIRSDGRSILNKLSCAGFDDGAGCPISDYCREEPFIISKNENFVGDHPTEYGTLFKIWRAPDGYINRVITVLGNIPTGLQESEETTNENDDFLWADWTSGVTIPPEIVGVSPIRVPSATEVIPTLNISTTQTNANIIDLHNSKYNTTRDTFMVGRGFVKSPKTGYFQFTLNLSNNINNTNISEQHVSLFSLKHKTSYTLEDIQSMTSLSNITFERTPGYESFDVIDNDAVLTKIHKKSEYGICEVRQTDSSSSSDLYYLEEGKYYAFEIKTAYGSAATKSLNLAWESFNEKVIDGITYFVHNMSPRNIPSYEYLTILEKDLNINESEGKGTLTIPKTEMEGGDSFIVSYSTPSPIQSVFGIISTEKKFKDFEYTVRVNPTSVGDYAKQEQQKSFGLVFRGISRGNNPYDNVDTYYSLMYDGSHSEISLVQVSYNKEIENHFYRYLNLNPKINELDKLTFALPITDSNGHLLELENDQYYDFKLIVQDNKVTAKYRKNDTFTYFTDSIINSKEINVETYSDNVPYITLFENISLTQDDNQTETRDSFGHNIDIAEKYSIVDEPGYYGVEVKSSAIKVSRIDIIPFDLVDESLSENVDKWKKIKPKWLDARNSSLLQYNSYGVAEVDRPTNPTFIKTVQQNYNGETTIQLNDVSNIDDSSINSVFVNGVDATKDGTRFNIYFDRSWIESQFKNASDVLERMVIPFGNFVEPVINWNRVTGTYNHQGHAGYLPILSENARVLPHTRYIKTYGEINSVHPCSGLSRKSNSELLLEGPLNTLLTSTNDATYSGIWEEVCPLSVSEMWNVPGIGSFANPVFAPIYRDNTTKNEVIGAKITNKASYDQIRCRYCEGATLWGLYFIILPDEAVQNFGYENNIEYKNQITYFAPVGKIENDNYILLPPVDLLRSGDDTQIYLQGIYAHHDFSGFEVVSDSNNIKINIKEPNFWESKYKFKNKCSYYLDVQTSFVAKLDTFNLAPLTKNASTPCSPGDSIEVVQSGVDPSCNAYIPNAFIMPSKIIAIFNKLETLYPDKTDTSDIENFDEWFSWWNPKTVWQKKPFEARYKDNSDSILNVMSGLSVGLTGQDTVPLIITNNKPLENGTYIVDSTWCVSSVGWDHEFASGSNDFNFSIFTLPTLSGSVNNYSLMGYGNGTPIDNEKIIRIAENMTSPFLLSTVTTSGNSGFNWSENLTKETGYDKTFAPAGLYNWYFAHSDVSVNGAMYSDPSYRAGWNISDLNDEFFECFKFNTVYGQVSTKVFNINKYWAFNPQSLPPFASIVNIKIGNQPCIEVDGANTPIETENTITLGLSDGLIGFYPVPPIVGIYEKWRRTVKSTYIDNYVLPTDYYFVSKNTVTGSNQLVLNTQTFDFTKYYGGDINVDFLYDRVFSLTNENKYSDNFNDKREINWITLIDDGKKYTVGERLPDTELKYTSNSEPYTITKYKGQSVYKLENKFTPTGVNAYSGSTESTTKNIGINGNGGSINPIQLIDIAYENYEMACDVIFDPAMLSSDMDKKFELIAKADNKYSIENNEWGVTNFYFVGFGTYGFDIGLGMRSLDNTTGEVKETYLASYGEFNARSIKPDVWYTLKVKVTNDSIKVYYNERGLDPELVLNYNINKKYEKLTERYLKGHYDTLQAILVGLNELNMTYPSTLGNKVSAEYTFKNFQEEFAATLPIRGFYAGFRAFNPLTYVTNVKYTAFVPKKYKFGSTLDATSYAPLISRIERKYSIDPTSDIIKLEKTIKGNTYIQIDDTLYYQIADTEPQKYFNNIQEFHVSQDKIFILEKKAPTDGGIGINYYEKGDQSLVWSFDKGKNLYGIRTIDDFYPYIKNLTKVTVFRGADEYISQKNPDGTISGSRIEILVGDIITFTIGCDTLSLQTLSIQQLQDLTILQLEQLPIDPDDICETAFVLGNEYVRYDIILRTFHDGMDFEYAILAQDNTFYKDNINKYMEFADKKIKEIHINDDILHVLFNDNQTGII